MKRLNVVELKNSLGDVLNKAEYQGERTIVHRRGKDSAAIISIPPHQLPCPQRRPRIAGSVLERRAMA